MYIENGVDRAKVYRTPMDALVEILSERGLDQGRLGLETESISVTVYNELRRIFPKAIFTDCTDVLSSVRSIKTKEAIDLIAEATRITDRATEALIDSIRVGATEQDLKKAFAGTVSEEGGDMYRPAHLILHTRYGPVLHRVSQVLDYSLKDGDTVRIDAGAAFRGWTSDICRTTAAGTIPDRFKRLYDVLRAAEKRVIENIRPGTKVSELFRVGQSYVRERGYQAYTRYMLGHGIGLSIHEEPLIAPASPRQLEPGMVLTVEVPYYFWFSGGLGIEDVILVTDDGYRLLSSCVDPL
jgi:Xaa-Pro aminopeptidase